MLRDCCGELYKLNVRGKLYRLVFNLNKDTKIRVKTPVGLTDYSRVDECLGQGTNESGIISSMNLAGGVSEYFEDSTHEPVYYGLQLSACCYQDDVARLANNLEAVQEGNIRMERMGESKLLNYNHDKTSMIIFGSKKYKRNIMKQLKQKPVIFCNKPMHVKEFDRYLGEYIGSSLSESVFETVKRRQGLIYRLISEIKVTIEDCRSNSLGGILVGLDIWKIACEPYLFNNCQCWVSIPKKAINLLSHLQNSMFRALFQQPKSCPIPSFLWDTKTLLVENYIKMKKLLFFHFLANLSDSSLAKEVFLIQMSEKEPNCLVAECLEYLQELQITVDPEGYSKGRWKSLIKSRIYALNRSQLLT